MLSPARQMPYDALVSPNVSKTLDKLPQGLVLVPGSLRRQAQLLHVRLIKVEVIRGNGTDSFKQRLKRKN